MADYTVYLCSQNIRKNGIEENDYCKNTISSYVNEDGKLQFDIHLNKYLHPTLFIKFGEGGYLDDGITYIPTISAIRELDPNLKQYTYYIMKEGYDNILCNCIDDFQATNDIDSFNKNLLDWHNKVRAEYSSGTLQPLALSQDLIQIAQWSAKDYAEHDGLAPHIDSLGRDPQGRYNAMINGGWSIGENFYKGEYNSDYHLDIIDLAMQGWILSPHHFENIVYPNYTHVGFAYYKHFIDDYHYRVIIVAIFGVAPDTINLSFPLPNKFYPKTNLDKYFDLYGNCLTLCAQHMKWEQLVIDNPDFIEEDELDSKIVFYVPFMKCCNIKGVKLTAEYPPNIYSHTFIVQTFNSQLKPIPEDNSLQYTYPFDSYIPIIIDTADTTIYPGAIVKGWLLLENDDGVCDWVVVGVTAFETRCFTSAYLESICIVEEHDDGTFDIVEEDLFFDENKHISLDIRYKVTYSNGMQFYLKSSDFAKYDSGDIVLIWKNGQTKTKDDNYLEECFSNSKYATKTTPINNDVVRYTLDEENDLVVPFEWYGGI